MNTWNLRLFEDVLSPNCLPVYLPAAQRAVYVAEGDVTVEHPTGNQRQPAETAWLGASPIAYLSGPDGARLYRWELVRADATDGEFISAPAATSECKLVESIELDSRQEWLMRCDEVAFPPGGIAYTHVHQGPGIRCCIKGEIRCDSAGQSHTYVPGSPWLERGYEPVLAPTTEAEPTAFVRCLILPRLCKARSSIRYVHPDDIAKQKPQRYRVFGERFIDTTAG